MPKPNVSKVHAPMDDFSFIAGNPKAKDADDGKKSDDDAKPVVMRNEQYEKVMTATFKRLEKAEKALTDFARANKKLDRDNLNLRRRLRDTEDDTRRRGRDRDDDDDADEYDDLDDRDDARRGRRRSDDRPPRGLEREDVEEIFEGLAEKMTKQIVKAIRPLAGNVEDMSMIQQLQSMEQTDPEMRAIIAGLPDNVARNLHERVAKYVATHKEEIDEDADPIKEAIQYFGFKYGQTDETETGSGVVSPLPQTRGGRPLPSSADPTREANEATFGVDLSGEGPKYGVRLEPLSTEQ